MSDLSETFDFAADAKGFEWKNAVGCANAALLAYFDEDAILSRAKGVWKMTDACFFDEGGSTQAFAMTNDEIVLVAFRGTESDQSEDLRVDAGAKLKRGPLAGEVHGGFWDALNEVWWQVERKILEYRGDSTKTVWITGHSLGAGLATLATAALLGNPRRPIDGLYTFGQPRTGDEEFAKEFDKRFKSRAFRFVNNNDVVTRIAPTLAGYRHVGTFRYFDDEGNYQEDTDFWDRFKGRIKGRMDDLFVEGTAGIKDHSMNGYLELVKKAAG